MPRRQTPLAQSLYYHIYNRGNNRQSIFFQPENYLYFLGRMKKYIVPLAKVVSYCLMPTHYHMLLRVEKTSEFLKNSEVSLSNTMMRLSVSYTKAINKHFSALVHFFRVNSGLSQFKSIPICSTYVFIFMPIP